MSTDPAIYSALSSPSYEKPRAESILEILWRRKQTIFVVFLLVMMAAAAVVQFVPKRKTAEARVMVTRTLSSGAEDKGADTNVFLNTQCELIKSTAVLSQAVGAPGMDQLGFFEGADNSIELLKSRIEIKPVPDTTVIAIRVASQKEDEAKTIVNAVAQSYVAQVSDQHRNAALDIYNKMVEQRKAKQDERDQAKRYLLTMQAETQSAIPGAASQPTEGLSDNNFAVQKLKQLSDDLNDAQTSTIKTKGQYEDALQLIGMSIDNIDKDKLADATAVSTQSLPLLAKNLQALNQQLVEAKRQFVPTHPAVRMVQRQIKDMQLSQAATLKNMYESAQSHERDARALYLNQEQVAHDLNAKGVEMAMAASKLKQAEHDLGELDTKMQQLQVSETIGFDARQLDEATVDPKSATPNTLKTIGFAGIAGLVLGMMIALAREWVSPSLGSAHSVADRVGIPVLGTLPRVQGRGSREMARLTQDSSDTEAAEAFRSIRTSMLFGSAHCRTVTITSPALKDGKSILACNLAISLAQSGKRVVLIDANFRDPAIHNLFDMDNVIGLTSVLDGDDLESSLRRTNIEHLDVLTAGPKSEGASEKLNSTQFGEFIRDLTMRYDHVIFDTPAVAGNNDARIIAANCDQTILIVRGERSNRYATTTARDALLSVGAQIMGLVMNDWQRPQIAYPSGTERRDNPTAERAARLSRARESR